MLKKVLYYATCVLLAVSVSGCSLLVPHNQTISINGQPAGATVIVNGRQMMAPATLSVRRNKHLNITVTKKGYAPYTLNSSYSLSAWGVLDIVGGVCFLVPFVGLVAPGAYDLDHENFYYVLTPNK